MEIFKLILFVVVLIFFISVFFTFMVDIFTVSVKYNGLKKTLIGILPWIIVIICLTLVVLHGSNLAKKFYTTTRPIVNDRTKIAASELGEPFYVYNNDSITNRYLFTPERNDGKEWIYVCEGERYRVSYLRTYWRLAIHSEEVETYKVRPIDSAPIRAFKIKKITLLCHNNTV